MGSRGTSSTDSVFPAHLLTQAPDDPLYGLVTAYASDDSEQKVDLGVGAYRDDDAQPWILPSIANVRPANPLRTHAILTDSGRKAEPHISVSQSRISPHSGSLLLQQCSTTPHPRLRITRHPTRPSVHFPSLRWHRRRPPRRPLTLQLPLPAGTASLPIRSHMANSQTSLHVCRTDYASLPVLRPIDQTPRLRCDDDRPPRRSRR